MYLRIIILRPRLLFWGIVTILVAAVGARAKVAQITLQELVRSSDLIVVAEIESVDSKDTDGERMAKGHVIETWKGAATGNVLFSIERKWVDDGSNAIVEHVVLFLKRDESIARIWYRITHSGNGRMQMQKKSGDWELSLSPAIDVSGYLPKWNPQYNMSLPLSDLHNAGRQILASRQQKPN